MEGIAEFDLAKKEIPVGMSFNPDLVNLKATKTTNCQWISLTEMEKHCKIGEHFVVKQVNQLKSLTKSTEYDYPLKGP